METHCGQVSFYGTTIADKWLKYLLSPKNCMKYNVRSYISLCRNNDDMAHIITSYILSCVFLLKNTFRGVVIHISQKQFS